MKVLYCSYSAIPSNFANSIAVMKQCAALNSLVKLRTVLVKGNKVRKSDIFSLYGVNRFPMLLLPRWTLLFHECGLKLVVLIYAMLFRPDVVYTRDILLNQWLCRFRVNNIYEMHQLDQEKPEFDAYFKKMLSRIMGEKSLQAIVCISNSLAGECERFGVSKDKISVLHSGVDLTECDNAVEAELQFLSADHPIAVYVGSLQKGKGIDQIIQMADLAPEINFAIVGGTSGEIQEKENLKHIPRVSHSKALSYMKTADFLLLPTTEQSYKFHSPLKLFEYIAMGKTVIASDNADIREIIVPMENGILADSKRPEDFINKINQVSSQPQLKKHMEENAKICASHFTWEARATKIIDLVRSIHHEKD